jgi:hypothetical protein
MPSVLHQVAVDPLDTRCQAGYLFEDDAAPLRDDGKRDRVANEPGPFQIAGRGRPCDAHRAWKAHAVGAIMGRAPPPCLAGLCAADTNVLSFPHRSASSPSRCGTSSDIGRLQYRRRRPRRHTVVSSSDCMGTSPGKGARPMTKTNSRASALPPQAVNGRRGASMALPSASSAPIPPLRVCSSEPACVIGGGRGGTRALVGPATPLARRRSPCQHSRALPRASSQRVCSAARRRSASPFLSHRRDGIRRYWRSVSWTSRTPTAVRPLPRRAGAAHRLQRLSIRAPVSLDDGRGLASVCLAPARGARTSC